MHSLRLSIGWRAVRFGKLSCNACLLAERINIAIFEATIGSKNLDTAIETALNPGQKVFKLLCGLIFGFGEKDATIIGFIVYKVDDESISAPIGWYDRPLEV